MRAQSLLVGEFAEMAVDRSNGIVAAGFSSSRCFCTSLLVDELGEMATDRQELSRGLEDTWSMQMARKHTEEGSQQEEGLPAILL